MSNAKLMFGALISVILLGLYAFSLIDAIQLAYSVSPKTVAELDPGIAHTLTIVGGLVSALVIAELAISKPGDPPGARLLVSAAPGAPAPSSSAIKAVAVISIIYVMVWILLGLAAYVVGEMLRPGTVRALTDFGQAWLGLAVAAGYAFFGMKQ